MAIVRFAMICDRCGKRSREYGAWFTCRECLDDICDTCAAPATTDDETARCVCAQCQPISAIELLIAKAHEVVRAYLRQPSGDRDEALYRAFETLTSAAAHLKQVDALERTNSDFAAMETPQ